jgi:hypothetical protein
MYSIGYEVHSIGCKSKLINYNQYNLWVYKEDPHFFYHVLFCTSFRKVKFCCVHSGAIVEVGCSMGKKRLRNTAVGVSPLYLKTMEDTSMETLRFLQPSTETFNRRRIMTKAKLHVD